MNISAVSRSCKVQSWEETWNFLRNTVLILNLIYWCSYQRGEWKAERKSGSKTGEKRIRSYSKQLVKGRNREVPAVSQKEQLHSAGMSVKVPIILMRTWWKCRKITADVVHHMNWRAPQDFLLLMDSPHTQEMDRPCQEHYSRKESRISFQTQNLKGKWFQEMWEINAK